MFLVIHDDKPIYELDCSQTQKQVKQYFLIHSSLDSIDNILKSKRDFFLGQIKTQQILLYAYVNTINIKFVLVLPQKKQVDKALQKSIKEFFAKANEALAQAFLNPLYRPKEMLKSKAFDEKIRKYFTEYLRPISQKKK